jgi:thiamine-phosphate pyrophosphorylase
MSKQDSLTDCGLYLPVPATLSPALEDVLAELLAEADVASILLVGDPSDRPRESVLRLRDLAGAHEAAFLLDGHVEMAAEIGADGVHLPPDPQLYRRAREALGQRAVIGFGSVGSRHLAMVLAELGADYVAFGPLTDDSNPRDHRAELIAWWSEIFVVPSVVWDVENPEDAARFASLGADFIAPSLRLWDGTAPLKEIAAIDEALQTGGRNS